MSDRLDEVIRQLVVEVDDAAPSPVPFSSIRARRAGQPSTGPSRRFVAAVATLAVVVVAVAAGVVVVVRDRAPRVVTTPPPTVTTVPAPSSTVPSNFSDALHGLLAGVPAGAETVVLGDLARWRTLEPPPDSVAITFGQLWPTDAGGAVPVRPQRSGPDPFDPPVLQLGEIDTAVWWGPQGSLQGGAPAEASILVVGLPPDELLARLTRAGYADVGGGVLELVEPAPRATAGAIHVAGSRLVIASDPATVSAVVARLDAGLVDPDLVDAAAQSNAPLRTITTSDELELSPTSTCNPRVVIGWSPVPKFSPHFSVAVRDDGAWISAEGDEPGGQSTAENPSAMDALQGALTQVCGPAEPVLTDPPATTTALPADRVAELAAVGSEPALDLLRRLPAAGIRADDSYRLHYVDAEAVSELLGVDTSTASPFGVPQLFRGHSADDIPAMRQEVGFDVTSVRREAQLDALPFTITAADLDATPADIDGAVRTDPMWADLLTTTDDDGVTFYDWSGGQPYTQDLASGRAGPMHGGLGVGGQLLVEPTTDGASVVRTVDITDMRAVAGLDPSQSVVETGPYAAALQRLPAGRLIEAFGTTSLPSNSDPDVSSPGTGPTIAPVVSVLLASTVDTGGVHSDLLLTHTDDQAATANVDRIHNTLATGTTAQGQPLAELYPEPTITAEGPVVHVSFEQRVLWWPLYSEQVFATD